MENIGAIVIRYGLAAVLIWVSLLKFTAFEAEGIQSFVANSPLMSWAYGFPCLSPVPGQFVAKDLLFLGAALWTAGEAWRAANPVGGSARMS